MLLKQYSNDNEIVEENVKTQNNENIIETIKTPNYKKE